MSARYSFDGQGVIHADGRIIARDEPTNPTSGADLNAMIRAANAARELAQALRDILEGSQAHGVWRDEAMGEGRPFDMGQDADAEDGDIEETDDGATLTFREYDADDQLRWIGSVADIAERALAKLEPGA